MGDGLVAGLDVGTTRIKLAVYDSRGWRPVYTEEKPSPWSKTNTTRHDPTRLYKIVKSLYHMAREKGASCLGLATYRGSLIVWEAKNGRPVTDIITWMDTESHAYYYEKMRLLARLLSKMPRIGSAIQPESFLVRLAALLDEKRELRLGLESGELYAWNIDSYLVQRLTGLYVTDPSIAGLTGLYHPRDMKHLWFIAQALGLPRFNPPKIIAHDEPVDDYLTAVMGDQQAAIYGLECEDSCIKISLGTGAFIDAPTGPKLYLGSGRGLVPLIVYWSRKKRIYGLEAYIPGLGEAVRRLVEGLLGGDYSLLDEGKDSSPAKVLLYAWGVRYPRLPPGPLTVKFDKGDVSPWSLAGGIVESVVEAVAYHFRLLVDVVGVPERVVLTGGLTRSREITRRITQLLADYKKNMRVEKAPGNPVTLGIAKIAYENCQL